MPAPMRGPASIDSRVSSGEHERAAAAMADGEGRRPEVHVGTREQLVLQRARVHVVDEVVRPRAELDALEGVLARVHLRQGLCRQRTRCRHETGSHGHNERRPMYHHVVLQGVVRRTTLGCGGSILVQPRLNRSAKGGGREQEEHVVDGEAVHFIADAPGHFQTTETGGWSLGLARLPVHSVKNADAAGQSWLHMQL